MTEQNDNNKVITIILAIVITFAAIAILYVSLPEANTTTDDSSEGSNNDSEDIQREIVLTMTYDSEEKNFTLSELEDLQAFSGSGSYLKTKALPEVIIKGPYSFTGIKFSFLMNQMDGLPDNYNITVTATDGWTSEYTMNQTNGVVNLYNESGNVTEDGTVTMILAYKEDEEYITDEEVGPLRVAFVGDDVITASNLWSKMVESIEIIEV